MSHQQAIDEIWAMFRQTDRKFLLTDRELQATIKRTNEAIGRLGNRLGDFVEGLVKPAVARIFRERGIDVREVHRDMSARRDGLAAQIDLLVVDDTVSAVVEVKSHLGVDDVNEHLERMAKFKRVFPGMRTPGPWVPSPPW